MKIQLLKLITLLAVFNFSTVASNCSKAKPEISLPENYSTNLDIIEFASNALRYSANGITYSRDLTEIRKADKRKIKDSSSPAYLDAIGRIKIYFTNGKVAGCTGSLISTQYGSSSRVIQSAAHCFGNTETSTDFSIKKITWESKLKSGENILKVLKKEEVDYKTDIAILTTSEKIPFVKIKPFLLETEVEEYPDFLISYADEFVAAGHSADTDKGDGGKNLTYDDTLKRRTVNRSGNRNDPIIETVTYGGASGGPLLVSIDLSEDGVKNPHGQMYIIGSLIGGVGESTQYDNNNVKGSTQAMYSNYFNIISMGIDKFN